MLFQNVRGKKGFCDIKSRDIDNFYHEHIDFDSRSDHAKAFKRVCDLLAEQFKGHPKIVGYQMIDLLLYADSILRSDYVSGWERKLPQALHVFNEKCRQGSTDNKENKDTECRPYFTLYSQWGRVGSDTGSSIRKRQEFFARRMDDLVALTPKDSQRRFTDRDKERIFYRDNQQCQYCAMKGNPYRVAWGDAEIHHVIPHNEGGRTSIHNGALVHKDFHPKAKADVQEFRLWWKSEGRGERVKSDEKPVRVSLPTELPPDGTLCKWSHEGKEYLAEIRDRKIHSRNSEFSPEKAFSTVIKQIAGISRNGWDYWQIKLPDSERWVFASDWRRSESEA